MKTKQEKINEQVKLYEEIYKRKLTDEELAFVKSQFENPIAKEIELRDGEIDIRELSDKDFKQLFYREICDMNLRLKFTQEIMNECVMALYGLLKAQGKDPFKYIEDITNEAMEKMKDGELIKH